ncbi:reverse transcriptase [Gossypium australe]|uniref:Reverse transcriptase n=1 Tax=Gossypium australe TaxID=47621 RepID=A0A5B6V7N5_9ROSI|nr:reverse transcriptase [Gossypium australe]
MASLTALMWIRKVRKEGYVWLGKVFYGSPYAHDKDESWNLLRSLKQNNDIPWFVSGDFNEVMYGFEKKGGLPREERRMEAFRSALEDC